jgi:glycosyltransferase involved in cell wall biosynthesis
MLNEERHIARCLDSILAGTFPIAQCEILVVDGGSSDASRAIVNAKAAQCPAIRLLDNPRRIQGAAMNVGLANARGQYVVRMDAHSEYPPDYVAICVSELERTGAWNVGGTWNVTPGADTFMARAVALTVQHRFGVGNTRYRLGGEGFVDTVPFGAYRRDLFTRIGGYDEKLARHEDFELNGRIRRAGGMVYLSPSLSSVYYCSPTLKASLRKAWAYGHWSARCSLIYPYCFVSRRCAPLLFVLLLAVGIPLSFFSAPALALFSGIMAVYVALALVSAVQLGRRAGWAFVPILPLLFFLRHVAYGTGMLAGIAAHAWRVTR